MWWRKYSRCVVSKWELHMMPNIYDIYINYSCNLYCSCRSRHLFVFKRNNHNTTSVFYINLKKHLKVYDELKGFCAKQIWIIDMFQVMDIMWPISHSHFHVSCFFFIEMKLIHFHSCVMFVMKSMSICNDILNYNVIIIQWSKHTLWTVLFVIYSRRTLNYLKRRALFDLTHMMNIGISVSLSLSFVLAFFITISIPRSSFFCSSSLSLLSRHHCLRVLFPSIPNSLIITKFLIPLYFYHPLVAFLTKISH